MQLDCASTTGDALKYAIAKGYCTSEGTITPTGIAYGSCGWAAMFVANVGGGGRAAFTYGFGSSLGTVVYRSLVVTWVNSSGPSGAFPDSSAQFSSTYSTTRTVTTGSGSVLAQLTGYVVLIWGGVCTVLSPTDAASIT